MIKENDVVELHYTGKFEDGEVFDSSLDREPIRVQVGTGNLIKGFENSLFGKTIGEKFDIEVSPEDGYGEIREDLIIEVAKDKMPGEVEVGQYLSANAENGNTTQVVVKEIKEDSVVIDGNHPLSGQKLFFSVEVVSIL